MAAGFTALSHPVHILVIIGGTLISMLLGALPGIGGVITLSLLLPISFKLSPDLAMVMFGAFIGGLTFGGSISAILLNTPGTAANVATTFDGHPMARQGKAGTALGISAAASAMGSLFGYFVLIGLIPLARMVVLAFSPPEFFLLALLGISAIAVVTEGEVTKGLISGGLGFLVSFTGFDPMTGTLRYTFGIQYLWDGYHTAVVVLGLFAISEMIHLTLKGGTIAEKGIKKSVKMREVWEGVMEVFHHFGLFVRSSVIGTIVGIIPGIGAVQATFLAYIAAKMTSKNPERFGKGSPEGIIAPEAANDAKDGGAMLPTVTFGIPGSPPHAILLAAFLLQGLDPGPSLLSKNLPVLFTLIFALMISNVLTSVIGIAIAPQLARITNIRLSLIVPFILTISLVGAYGIRNNFNDVFVALIFGFIGYGIKRFKYSFVTFTLAFVLGNIAEISLHQSLLISDVGLAIFIVRPISLALVILIFAMLSLPFFIWRRKKRMQQQSEG